MISVLWAYESWQYVTFSAGETINPQRTFPLAFLIGTITLIVIYLLANAGYVSALGAAGVANSTRVAASALSVVVGSGASKIVGIAILVSMFSAANAIMLTAPRVYYAMAADGLFFRSLARIHPTYGTPAFAIGVAGSWSALLAAIGSFEQLLTFVVFIGWIFYALAASSLFVYRSREPNAVRTYRVPGPLPQGAFGSAGGLLTTAGDLGRYVAFHLSAWPPRDEPDEGPVRRNSLREMTNPWTPYNLTARRAEGKPQIIDTAYGYGLRVRSDCRFERIVWHSGGLPGFGSVMAWLPDYGVGIFAMATLTYSGPSEVINSAWDALLQTGGLQRRELPPSPLFVQMRQHVVNLWSHWDEAEAKQVGAMNLLLDAPSTQRRDEIRALQEQVGECTSAGPVIPENWLRGQVNLSCAHGIVGAFFTLSPTNPPTIQHLSYRKIASDAVRIGAPTGAPAGVSCAEGL